jgi:hypothetical protein
MSIPVIGYPFGGKMCRVPVFITGKNNTLPADQLDEMTLGLKIYTGAKTLPAGSNDFSLSKDYSVGEVINFEISDLIRSKFTHNFSIYNSTGYQPSSNFEVLWVAPLGSYTYSDNGAAPTSGTWSNSNALAFLALDGWFDDSGNVGGYTGTPMYPSRERYVLPNQYGLLAISNAITKIRIEWSNGSADDFFVGTTSVSPPSPNNTTNNAYIYAGVYPKNLEDNGFLPIDIKPSDQPANGVGLYYDVIGLNGTTQVFRERFHVTCEPKYTPYQLSYVNRFGFLDYLTFFKRSDRRGTFTEDNYQKSIYNDSFTNPVKSIGKYQSYNINSRDSYILNTGFVGQDHDRVIEDILMSEQVCLLLDGQWVAVVPERGSVEYQKHVNEKLINYTMTFNKGFDQRDMLR